MSLINKMLHELEKNKKSDFASLPPLSSVNPNVSIKKPGGEISRWKIIYWLIILLLALGVIWYYHPQSIFGLSKTPKIQPKKPLATKQLKSDELAIGLQNISLEHKNNQTILDFVLSAPASYYLEYASEQHLMIILNKTKILGNLPVSLDNSFIVALNTKQNDTNVVSTLTLLPGTKIDDVRLISQPQTHLHIVFSNPQLTSGAMSKMPAPPSPEEQETKQWQEIQQLLEQDRMQSAISNLYLFVGDYPNNLEARTLLASLLITNGQLQKANDVLTIGLNKHPHATPLIILKAHVLVNQNKTQAAIDWLLEHPAVAHDIEYLALLAALYQKEEHFIPAAALYDQLTRIEPQKTLWWIGLGISLEKAGKQNAAKIAYQQAYKIGDITSAPDLASFLDSKIKTP